MEGFSLQRFRGLESGFSGVQGFGAEVCSFLGLASLTP